jgi:hypothetical protein
MTTDNRRKEEKSKAQTEELGGEPRTPFRTARWLTRQRGKHLFYLAVHEHLYRYDRKRCGAIVI